MTPLPESLLGDTRWLRRLARSLVDDPHDAADVVQDTVVRALQLPPQNVERPRSFLATVMRNLVYDRMRREGRRPEVEKRAARLEFVPATGDTVARESVRRSLVDAVRGLDEPYRGALWLRFFEDLPPREVAARLRVPVETARTRLKRGLAQLRVQLDREHGKRAAWTGPLFADLGLRVTGTAGLPMPLGALVMGTGMVAATAAVAVLGFGPEFDSPPRVETPRLAAAPAALGTEPTDVTAELHRLPVPSDPAERAPLVEGFVVDEQSRLPLANVMVTWRGCDEAVATSTDANGRFRLTTAPLTGVDCELVVARQDFVRQVIELSRPREDLALGEITMPPGTLVSGRVVEADGAPAPDTEVYAVLDFELSLGWPPGSAVETRARIETARKIGRTDRVGNFVAAEQLAPISTREVLLAVSPRGVGWVDVSLRRARSSSAVVVELRPETVFEAVCRNELGEPVPGARATLEPRFSPLGTRHAPLVDAFAAHPELSRRLTATADAAGVIRLESVPLPPDDDELGYAVLFEAPGFAPCRIASAPLDAIGGRALEVRLERNRPLRLTGVVRDATGRAVAGAAVVARSGKRSKVTRTSRTDASGRYVIEGLENSLQDAVALARADGYALSMGFVSFGSANEATLDLELEATPPARVSGRAPVGSAPTSLRADLFDARGLALDAKSVRLVDVKSRHALPLRLTIGRVEAEGLYAGDWLLRVTPHDGPAFDHPFEIRPDQDRVHVTCMTDRSVIGPGSPPLDESTPSVTVRVGERLRTIRLPAGS